MREITPAVTLREYKNRMVEEYRVNDNLYLHDQDRPKRGRALLVDEDGLGDMVWHRSADQFEKKVPQ